MTKKPRIPKYIGKSGRVWLRRVLEEFEFSPADADTLYAAAVCLDRIEQARDEIAEYGITVPTADGSGRKASPAVAIERDQKILFARLCREMKLYDVGDDPRLPRS